MLRMTAVLAGVDPSLGFGMLASMNAALAGVLQPSLFGFRSRDY
jgi:hypothetical protein